jgi:hypothetical protein
MFKPGDRVETIQFRYQLATVLLPIGEEIKWADNGDLIIVEIDGLPGFRCPLIPRYVVPVNALQALVEGLDV